MTHKMPSVWLMVLFSITGLFSLASQSAMATPSLLPIICCDAVDNLQNSVLSETSRL